MQIIQTIRNKGAAIVIGVIALSLIGFILMDAKPGGNSDNGQSVILGKVNGQKIESADFYSKVKIAELQETQESGGKRPNSARSAQIREGVWEQMIQETIFFEEAKKLDIELTPTELTSILMSNDPANPLMNVPGMLDSATQKINPAKVQDAIRNIKKLKGEEKEITHAQLEYPIMRGNILGKYLGLLNSSAYYPAWMQQKDSIEAISFATISYTAIPYNVISDSAIKVTDADIENYVKEHKQLFKQEPGRILSYVSFSALPNENDSARVLESINRLKETFASDTNSKAFVLKNSSNPQFIDAFLPKSRIPSSAIDTIVKQPQGTVAGPYVDGNSYVIAKVLGSKSLPDSVSARHILIGVVNPQTGEPTMPDSIAKKLADSILTAVKNGADFSALAMKYSTDQGSKIKGGDLGTFGNGEMVPEFNDFVFTKTVGQKDVVKSQYGYHIIDIVNQTNFNPAYKIAFVSKEIEASQETANEANIKANKLSVENRSLKSLDAYVQKNGIQKTKIPNLVKESDYVLGSLQDARQLIRWAFDAKEGEVSDPFSIDDQFVIAVVEKVYKEGTQDAATARAATEALIRKEKKAAEIIKKIGANATLESAATLYGKQVVSAGQDSSITFNSRIIKEMGAEPKVIGAAFNKENQTKASAPIIGNSGVYLLKVNSISSKNSDNAEMPGQSKNEKLSALRNQVLSGWFDALRKQATIKDNRREANM
ncbi:MAG: peptidylprolyl isomerase [Chitinophagaceae bacterium]|nr:peptidylprolyl isomerase [Chitinophagaceae bacterium]